MNFNKDEQIKALKEEIMQLKKELEKIKMETYTDCLTSINNRKVLTNLDHYEYLLMGDLDDFKIINDNQGHIIGDAVLVAVSQILKSNIDKNDILCRWGGEEFIILFKTCNEKESLEKANFIRNEIEKLGTSFDFNITMSFGLTKYDDNKTITEIIDEADQALYESKRNGKNMVSLYKPKVKSQYY